MGGKVGLLTVFFNDQPFRTGIGAPIEMAKIIAGNILAVLGKLDRETTAGTGLVPHPNPIDQSQGPEAENPGSLDEFGGDRAQGSVQKSLGPNLHSHSQQESARNSVPKGIYEMREAGTFSRAAAISLTTRASASRPSPRAA